MAWIERIFMTTKYNVGDEFTLKVKVANIFTDRSGTSYMVNIVANNGENLAGSYMNYDEKTLERIVDKDGEKLTAHIYGGPYKTLDSLKESLDWAKSF